jgi:hypothetical protein
MKSLRVTRGALCLSIAAMVFDGCGSIGVPNSTGQNAAATRLSSTSEPLLYVVRGEHDIEMLSLPGYKAAGEIRGFKYVAGICADAAGNVWVTNYRNDAYVVDKFAHGGTQPIAELRAPKLYLLNGCAVDPVSGNLAVLAEDDYGNSWVLIWAGAKGKPQQVHGLCCEAMYASYDNDENLYISGAPGGDDWWFEFGELAKSGSEVVGVKLDKKTLEPGAVQWDGTYVVVATSLYRRGRTMFRSRYTPRVYRLQVVGTRGRVAAVVKPDRLSGGGDPTGMLFTLYGNTVIGIAHNDGKRFLAAWAYPGGGPITTMIARYSDVRGLAVSE